MTAAHRGMVRGEIAVGRQWIAHCPNNPVASEEKQKSRWPSGHLGCSAVRHPASEKGE